MAAVLVFGAGPPAAAGDAPPLPFGKLFGGPFSLLDQDGRSRTDRDFHGRYVLVYFGYTYCPDICPTSLQEMAAALDELGNAGKAVQPVFITIDPKRDTPEVLKAYVRQFGARFVGLSGPERETAKLAKAYRLHRVKVVPEWSSSDADYLVDHSSNTFLIGPDGEVLTLFPHNTPADTMAMRIRSYVTAGADG